MQDKGIPRQREIISCHHVAPGVYNIVRDVTTFKLNVTTSAGNFEVPRFTSGITLAGRQSKIIVTDYSFGLSSKVLYSTAQVLFAGQIGGRDVLFLYGDLTS